MITRPEELLEWCEKWDALAVTSGLPFSAPGWLLPWWLHVAPADARLNVVVVLNDGRLVGIAPFFIDRSRLGLVRSRLLGVRTSTGVQPLSQTGLERDVAAAITSRLAESSPRAGALMLEGLSNTSSWPTLLSETWPGNLGLWGQAYRQLPAPRVVLSDSDSFDAWLGAKSRNFRQQVRRSRRQLEKGGGRFGLASSEEELQRGLRALVNLHHARWNKKGGSRALYPAVETMLAAAARSLPAPERYRLWTIEIDGRIISAHLFVAAGGVLSYWLGGFDEALAAQHPSMQTLLIAMEHGWSVGDRVFDLGPGGAAYKYRLADQEDTLEWRIAIPRDTGHLASRLRWLPVQMARTMKRSLPQQMRQKLVGARSRLDSMHSLLHGSSGQGRAKQRDRFEQ